MFYLIGPLYNPAFPLSLYKMMPSFELYNVFLIKSFSILG